MAEVRWTPDALQDISNIHRYISQDSSAAASAVVLRIVASVATLDQFPRAGRVVPEFQREELRELIIGSFRVVYRLGDSIIEIIIVRHGARLLRRRDVEEGGAPRDLA